MTYWIFKVAKQELYPDVPGEQYVYDNTHSLRVRAGDTFLYLEVLTKPVFPDLSNVAKLSG